MTNQSIEEILTVLAGHDVDLLAPGPRAQPVVGLHHDGVLGVLLEVGEGEGEAVLRGRAERRGVESVALLLQERSWPI